VHKFRVPRGRVYLCAQAGPESGERGTRNAELSQQPGDAQVVEVLVPKSWLLK
jgi:hypothetical protein